MLGFITKNETTKAISIVVALITLAIVTQTSSMIYMDTTSNKLMVQLRSIDSLQNDIIGKTLSGNDAKTNTLKNQYKMCTVIKNYYRCIAAIYFVNYYDFSICSILFVTLLTIAVFLLANKGWQNSSLPLKAFLLTCIVISSIYYFLPSVLNNKENLNNNVKKIKETELIQADILSFANIIGRSNPLKIDTVLASNYQRIAANIEYFNAIDDSKLTLQTKEILDKLKDPSGLSNQTPAK